LMHEPIAKDGPELRSHMRLDLEIFFYLGFNLIFSGFLRAKFKSAIIALS
jgi:hypothetical protein